MTEPQEMTTVAAWLPAELVTLMDRVRAGSFPIKSRSAMLREAMEFRLAAHSSQVDAGGFGLFNAKGGTAE